MTGRDSGGEEANVVCVWSRLLPALTDISLSANLCSWDWPDERGPPFDFRLRSKGDIGHSGDRRLSEGDRYLFSIAYGRRQRSQVTKFRRLACGIAPFINLFGVK
jgi:hypothetical protein